jgi:hypothetical protein
VEEKLVSTSETQRFWEACVSVAREVMYNILIEFDMG